MMGRPRKPTILKILTGEKRPSRLNKGEPKPEVKVTACPRYLTGTARNEYNKLAPKLAALGLMSDLYVTSLAQYCQAYKHWREAEEMLEVKSSLHVTLTGVVKKSPLVDIASNAFSQMRQIASDFGLTPSAMAHLSIEKPEEHDEMVEFLARAKQRRTIAE